ncbi:hypothetical protein [Weissella confusa]|uniref:hypothetical protein n=1 Tax=Weissella confusa TaxID=1583 RepID=UPI0022E37852|nr:hypothetical protein [Weissella confusa]
MRIGRLIFGVMLGVISMWFSHDLHAAEHQVETMREFEQAWHLDEPDQTIRLEADIVDDLATGLEPRTQDVTLIGDGYELAFAPEQNKQPVSLTSLGEIKLAGELWLSGADETPLINARRVQALPDSNVSMSPGYQGRMVVADEVIINGQFVLHGSHGDMITAPNIQIASDGFVEAFGQTGGHVFATDSGGKLSVASGAHVSVSVLQQSDGPIVGPIDMGFEQVVIQDGAQVDIASIQPALLWQHADAAMVTVESGGRLQLTGLQQQAVVYKNQNGVSGGGLQVKKAGRLSVTGSNTTALIEFCQPTVLKIVAPAELAFVNTQERGLVYQRNRGTFELQQIIAHSTTTSSVVAEFSIQSLRVKGRGNGQTVSDLPYAVSTWVDSLNKLTARPLPAEEPMSMTMTPVSFGSVSKSYGQASRTAALPGTGVLTVQGSILKSWAVQLRLARPFTNRLTGQVVSPQLIANQQIITESFQEILSGDVGQTHATRFEMQIGDHDVIPIGDYDAELEIKLVAGP